VINKGEIVANDRLENLLSRQGHHATILVEFESPVEEEEMAKITGVAELIPLGKNRYRIRHHPDVDIRPEIFRFAADRKLSLVGLKKEEGSLENIFRELTEGNSDRD
jgi:ABC-2 type transport system ATP-binding protein